MVAASRNLLVVLTSFVAAFFVSALAQEAFSRLFPNLSHRIIGGTDVATWVLLLLLGLVFFLFGYLVPRLLRGGWLLVWLLFPIALVYLFASLGQPYAYRCNPVTVVGCWLAQTLFATAGAAVVIGYIGFSKRQRSSRDAV